MLRKKIRSFSALFLLVLCFGLALVSASSTWTVGPGESYTSIQAAVNAASAGDTIIVKSGTYNEHVTITKNSLTLQGEGFATTTIDGGGSGTVIYISDASGLTLSGLTVTNGAKGIHLNAASNNTIESCKVAFNSETGIYTYAGASSNTIRNCEINNNTIYGIDLGDFQNQRNNIIENNKVFANNGTGVNGYITTDGARVSGNEIYSNGAGITCGWSSWVIENNTLYSNTAWGINLDTANNCQIRNNNVHDNNGDGICDWGIGQSSNTFENNIIDHNTGRGFSLDSRARNDLIRNNIVSNNGTGFQMETGSPGGGNQIYGNDFIDNVTQVSYDNSYYGNLWDSSGRGNYWSDYTGSDTNGDGIGDTAYNIPGSAGSIDHYPLMTRANSAPAPTPNAIPQNGLVGEWVLGGNANDTSVNANHGTVYGATQTADRFGNPNRAYSFDGINDYIDIPNSSVFDFADGKFSLNVWVKYRSIKTDWFPRCNMILEKRELSGGNQGDHLGGFVLCYDGYTPESWWATWFKSTTGEYPQAHSQTAPLTMNTWYLLSAVSNGTSYSLYINGSLFSTTPYTGNYMSGNHDIYIGAPICYLDSYSDAEIDDLRIYNRALSDSEIQALYHEGGWDLAGVTPTPRIIDGIPEGYTWCAFENGSYTFNEIVDVAYGANGCFYYKNGVTGTIIFNNDTFGDPIFGVVKAGYYKIAGGSVSPTPTRTEPPVSTPSVSNDPGNLAYNPSQTGFPNAEESDHGWGGGTSKWDLIDNQRWYDGQWARGLAFTGGINSWMGEPAGWRQATINFGEPKTFNRIMVWHHGGEHIPNTYKLQYWNGSDWIDIFSTTNGHACLKYPDLTWSTPTENIFPAVTASKVRFELNNADIEHGWIYEFEVYNDSNITPTEVSTPTQMPTPTPTNTPTTDPTSRPTSTEAPTSTPIPTPTSTPTPTPTLTDTPTLTPTITPTAAPTVTPTPVRIKIFSDNFETAFSGWTIVAPATWYSGDPKNGTHSIQLQTTGAIRKTISTAGYKNIFISFYMGASSLDSSAENLQMSWYDGVSWTVLARIDDGTEDNLLHAYQFSLPAEAENNPNLVIKFKLYGDSTDDFGFMDNVVLKGDPISIAPSSTPTVTPTVTPTPTATPTPTVTPTPTPAKIKIFSDNFETVFNGWTTVPPVTWYTGSPKIGTHSIQLQSKGVVKQTISTVGYTNISISFYLGANSLDSATENLQMLWFDGSVWTVLARIDDGTEDNTLHAYQFSLPSSAANNPNFAVKFKLNGDSMDDYGFVDNVALRGLSSASL